MDDMVRDTPGLAACQYWKKHVANRSKVLRLIQETELIINPQWAEEKGEYLGYVIRHGVIRPQGAVEVSESQRSSGGCAAGNAAEETPGLSDSHKLLTLTQLVRRLPEDSPGVCVAGWGFSVPSVPHVTPDMATNECFLLTSRKGFRPLKMLF
ncbi:hypothetical protein NHX12_019551 [Muraenolepis orangiensis]|uniref:Uncharacterized protein n=1 Tax=Muraenolepis orangiensis TaxID=630683 RepID=A0A9Q0IXK9_9TELE|nr:hypothetical protein NHX12_019551 [Muraenolepis orangiensis]